MKQSGIKKLADAFGMLGYLATTLLWWWAVLLLVPWLSRLSSVKKIIIEQPVPAHQVMAQTSYVPPAWLLYVIVAVVFFVVLVAVIYVVRLPAKAVRTVSQATHMAAHKLATEIVRTPQPPKKRLFMLTEAIVWYIKIVLVLVPIVGVIITMFLAPLPFARSVVLAVTAYLVSWPVFWFLLQFMATIFDRKRRPDSSIL